MRTSRPETDSSKRCWLLRMAEIVVAVQKKVSRSKVDSFFGRVKTTLLEKVYNFFETHNRPTFAQNPESPSNSSNSNPLSVFLATTLNTGIARGTRVPNILAKVSPWSS